MTLKIVKALFLTFVLLILSISQSLAVDIVRVSNIQGVLDKSNQYKKEVLYRAMEITRDTYGPYIFEQHNMKMNRSRSLPAVIEGKNVNVYLAPSKTLWDEKTIPINVPVRLGLISYRLLLINKAHSALFEQVNTLDDLKKLTAGLRTGWSTTQIFTEQKFNMVQSQSLEGLFAQLNAQNFHYLPRSIYEIYDEMDYRRDIYSEIIIEPTLALKIPTFSYIYVSPNAPRLAKRLAEGMKKLFESGELNKMLTRFYQEEVTLTDLNNRKIIEIENPFFPAQDKKNTEKYWYKMPFTNN